MVMINRATKEITLKIVYYGPGLCGKTTNLEYIYGTANPDKKGKLLSVATETDRTLFFDFLPMELGTIRGMRVRVQLYTVPGQVFYDATRRIVLRGSDGVVFVADSQSAMMDANLESLENLKHNLRLNTLDPEGIPLVLQYNKQDLPNLAPVEEMEAKLNWRGVPSFTSVATAGQGVNETLRRIIEQVIRKLQESEESLKAAKRVRRPGSYGEPAEDRPSSGERPIVTAPAAQGGEGMARAEDSGARIAPAGAIPAPAREEADRRTPVRPAPSVPESAPTPAPEATWPSPPAEPAEEPEVDFDLDAASAEGSPVAVKVEAGLSAEDAEELDLEQAAPAGEEEARGGARPEQRLSPSEPIAPGIELETPLSEIAQPAPSPPGASTAELRSLADGLDSCLAKLREVTGEVENLRERLRALEEKAGEPGTEA
ncbi:MAG: ADP-ribosylation factor-like protein [Acidobacteriota bacterium]